MTKLPTEREYSVNTVSGLMMPCHTWPGSPHLFSSQTWISESRPIEGYGTNGKIQAELRFDDNCRNGHNAFSVTATVKKTESLMQRDIAAGGCMHDEIAAIFPELAHLIKWHLVSTDGPMHYVANTVYHASDRDYRGKRKGEPYAFDDAVTFGDNPISHKLSPRFAKFLGDARPHNGRSLYDFEILALDHKDRETFGTRYTFGGYGDGWHTAPFKTEREAEAFLYALNHCHPKFHRVPALFSEGKDRDLGAARRCAVWPDATDEQLIADPERLKADLVARLPELLSDFRAAVESVGFLWGVG